MNFNKNCIASVISMCMILGMVSCSSSNDITEDSKPSTETTQETITVEQKSGVVTNSLSSLSSILASTDMLAIQVAKEVIESIPSSDSSSDIEKLKNLLLLSFNYSSEDHNFGTFLNLCRINGEFTYDGRNWTVNNIFNMPNELKVNYIRDNKTYSIDVKYESSIRVTGPDLEKTIKIFDKEFTTTTYVDMPNVINITISEDEKTLATVNTTITLSTFAQADGSYYFDPSEDTAIVMTHVLSGTHKTFNTSAVSKSLIAGTTIFSKVDGEDTDELFSIYKSNQVSTEGTVSREIIIVIYATEYTPEITFNANVTDVQDLINQINTLLQVSDTDPDLANMCIYAINKDLGDGFKLTTEVDGQIIDLGTLTFDIESNGNGGYIIKPVLNIEKDNVKKILPIPDSSEVIQKLIALIKDTLENHTK